MASHEASFLFILIFCTIFCAHAKIVKPKSFPSKPRIFGGTAADKNEIPYVARIQSRSYPSNDICSGAIIDDRYILSSSRCINKIENYSGYGGRESRITAILGSADLNESDEMYEVDIEKTIQHPDAEQQFEYSGLAILRTAEKMIFSDFVGPIALPEVDVANENGIRMLIAGWGNTNSSHQGEYLPNRLQYLSTETLRIEECSEIFINNTMGFWTYRDEPERLQDFVDKYFPDKFCTINPDRIGAFRSDEGSPVVKDNILIGIHRDRSSLKIVAPQIHTNVYTHMDWIQQELNNDFE